MFGVIFLVLFPLLSQGKLASFTEDCKKSFQADTPPTFHQNIKGNTRYKEICQCLDKSPDTYHYATLYDTVYKIPVYSAYEFHLNRKGGNRPNYWYIEPQLDGGEAKCLASWEQVKQKGTNQAIDDNYEQRFNRKGYQKGHLYPVSHAPDENAIKATFTLTNAAPQECSFNMGPWKKHENDVINELKGLCTAGTIFIVTGVIPGNEVIGNNVRVAQVYWSAYCCVALINQQKISNAFYGPYIVGTVKAMTVNNLEVYLKIPYVAFSVFSGKC